MFLLSFIVLYLLWWMLLLCNTDPLMSYADSLLQVVTFPIVATFTGDSSRLLTDALKSPIHLLKVSSFRVYGLCVHCACVCACSLQGSVGILKFFKDGILKMKRVFMAGSIKSKKESKKEGILNCEGRN